MLFDQIDAQERFIDLWKTIVEHYHTARLPIIFELLNEWVLPDSIPWNTQALKTVGALLFTHQKAPWAQVAVEYDQSVEYPGILPGLEKFLQRALQRRAAYGW